MPARDKYFIVSIDGGGCRGIIPALLLQSLGNSALLKADLFAGTSTGSIIAGGLACGVNIDQIANVYLSQDANKTIFTPYHSIAIPVVDKLFFPMYAGEGVRSVVGQFPETKTPLAQLDKHCLLPSFLIDGDDADGPQWFARAFHNLGPDAGLGGYADTSTLDAILASAAAPLYFPPHQIGSRLFCDGGLMAQNPAMCALAALRHSGIVGGPNGVPLDQVSVLSLGTGRTESSYPPDPPDTFLPAYGMLGWMWPSARGRDTPGLPVMDAMSDGVGQLNDYQVRSVVGKENYRRAQLNFGKASFPMDDYKKNLGPDGLIARTRKYMESPEWQEIAAWALTRLG